jgi:foldase protein PrsA
VLAALSLWGCGGSSTAVVVGGHRIGKAAIEQSMYEQTASGSAFAGKVTTRQLPDPPDYSSCVDYLKAHEPRPVGAQAGSRLTQLKAHCKYEYEKEKLKALYFWIPTEWVAGEAAELGVQVSAHDVASQLALFERGFPSKAVMRRYLRLTREPKSTLQARMRLAVQSTRIEELLQARLHALSPAQRQARLKQYGEAFEAKWRARTDCKTGYVVPLCRQYKAPRTPPALVPPSVPLTNIAG